MIFLFTDFGLDDVYVGQVKAAIWRNAPDTHIVDLLHQAPSFNIPAGAHLLAALGKRLLHGDVCVAVVDPGVGSARSGVAVAADGRWYVGPDNGLLSVVAARATNVEIWKITWRPQELSLSFHGRDLFAPVAAWIAEGRFFERALAEPACLGVSLETADLAEVIYIDHYGNALTGLRSGSLGHDRRLLVGDTEMHYAPVFCEAGRNIPFWYENSIGLVEIAIDRGNAALQLGIRVGDRVGVAG